jgi:hypothetical protein
MSEEENKLKRISVDGKPFLIDKRTNIICYFLFGDVKAPYPFSVVTLFYSKSRFIIKRT